MMIFFLYLLGFFWLSLRISLFLNILFMYLVKIRPYICPFLFNLFKFSLIIIELILILDFRFIKMFRYRVYILFGHLCLLYYHCIWFKRKLFQLFLLFLLLDQIIRLFSLKTFINFIILLFNMILLFQHLILLKCLKILNLRFIYFFNML